MSDISIYIYTWASKLVERNRTPLPNLKKSQVGERFSFTYMYIYACYADI